MSAVPITPTICSTTATPCDTPPCPATGASIATDGALTPPGPDVETVVDFDVDVFEIPPTDAESINERILIGADAVYAVVWTATYGLGPPGGTITVRILVDGISNPELTFVHAVDTVNPTQVSEQVNIALHAGNALTVTVEPSFEGASILVASLAAVKVCGPATDVIIPQG